jgi:hypothetical protein
MNFTPNFQISFSYYINQMIEKYINKEKSRFRIIIIYSKDIDNTMIRRKNTKGQTAINKTYIKN